MEEFIKELARTGRMLPANIASRLRSPENVERLKNNVRIQSYVRPLTNVNRVLGQRGLGILKCLDSCERFVIGSYPVVKLCPNETNNLSDERVEMWLPISSTVAVGPWGAPGTETIIGMVDSAAAANINDSIAMQSSIIAGHSAQLVQEVRRRGLSASGSMRQ